MLRSLFHKIQRIVSDKADSWQSSRFPVAVNPANEITQAAEVLMPERCEPLEFNPESLRNRVVETEFGEEVQSETSRRVRIMQAGPNVPDKIERRVFTGEGLVTRNEEILLMTADGRFIKGDELHRGGKCHVCSGFSDKVYFCEVCRKPLCFSCARMFNKMTLCPYHHFTLRFHQDTWNREKEETPDETLS